MDWGPIDLAAIVAAGAAWTAWLNYKTNLLKDQQDRYHADTSKKLDATDKKIELVAEQTDGKLDGLRNALVDAAGARGELKAKAEAKSEARDAALPEQIKRQEKE
jgi:hypothetical protein